MLYQYGSDKLDNLCSMRDISKYSLRRVGNRARERERKRQALEEKTFVLNLHLFVVYSLHTWAAAATTTTNTTVEWKI